MVKEGALEEQSEGDSILRSSAANSSAATSTKSLLGQFAPSVQPLLATSFPSWKKWMIVVVVFMVQLSTHFNTAVYASGVAKISDHFGISEQAARVGQAVYLISYAIGALLWSPLSEDKGRRIVLQISLTLVNATQILCALAPNFGSIIVGRILGGLFSVTGSLSIGVVADLFGGRQEYAIALMILGSVGGSALGPIVGPFPGAYLSWRWFFWLQLIFGGFVQILHLVLVPETRSRIILEREVAKRRKTGEEIWPEHDDELRRPFLQRAFTTYSRPFEMLVREPIVICCSLLSGFSDALIFSFTGSFALIYGQWGFTAPLTATTFVPIWIGYLLSMASFIWPIQHYKHVAKRHPERVTPESRLLWLLWTGPLLVIGLFGFAWTSQGPPTTPYIAPMIFSALIGIANYAIYLCTISYTVASYGPYSSSAASGNTFVRNMLAGAAAMYTIPSEFKGVRQILDTLLTSISSSVRPSRLSVGK